MNKHAFRQVHKFKQVSSMSQDQREQRRVAPSLAQTAMGQVMELKIHALRHDLAGAL